jgi:plastocyanin
METSRKSPLRVTRLRAGAASIAAALALILALATGEAAPASTAKAGRASTVDIHNFAFHPGTLTVAKGSTVVFSNTSGVTHTATHAGVFDTHRIKPGKSVAVRFTQKGVFPYHCKIHNFMHGKIVVG